MSLPFLRVENLETHFRVERGFLFKKLEGNVKAVQGVTFSLKKGEILGLVGESGCGKSTLGRTILRLISPTNGEVFLGEENLTALKGELLRKTRKRFQMIFQDPYAS